jgi:aspartyl-tRNA(Asn)/glutamyl-tRNA(Gln) amidotransferase subunit B
VEANISVSKDPKSFGTKVEVKNLNSFRVVEKAVAYEIKRQSTLLDAGGAVIQETRGWDEKGEKTFSQRVKESSHDYRYFPDPDVPKLKLSEVAEFQNLKETLPELPWEKRARYKLLGLKDEDVETYVRDNTFDRFFTEVVDLLNKDRKLVVLASNYVTSDLVSYKDFGKLKALDFVRLIQMTGAGLISSRGAKEILSILVSSGGDPEQIAKEHDLLQKSDEGHLKIIVENVVRENPKVVLEYKNGKEAVLQFLVGQGMKASRGSANPNVLAEVFKKELKK